MGLYAYYYPKWGNKFPKEVKLGLIYLLLLEIGVQAMMFITGTPIGDSQGGTLGEFGTLHLALLELLIFCVFLGKWIANGKSRFPYMVSALLFVSSILGQMKIIPFASIALIILALVLQFRNRPSASQVARGVLSVVIASIMLTFIFFSFVPEQQLNDYESIVKPEGLESYLTLMIPGTEKYDVGRNTALGYVWNRISKTAITLVWGEGLGSRNESKVLGATGSALMDSELGLFTGSSLAVILGETGLAGIAAGIVAWLFGIYRLLRSIKKSGQSDALWLKYGLCLYTIMWPLWVWYGSAWVYPVSSTFYWILIGYIFGKSPSGNRHPFIARAITSHA